MEADLSLCLFEVKSHFPHISEAVKVLHGQLSRDEFMVRLMAWRGEIMILPHIFCDGVKRAHGCFSVITVLFFDHCDVSIWSNGSWKGLCGHAT